MSFSREMIAQCGIDCSICIAYLRTKNKCNGCNSEDSQKVPHCSKCSIKLCEEHQKYEFFYCYECLKFPCKRIKNLDKRYVEKYHLSVIDNFNYIKQHGVDEFVKMEQEKWKCKHCGAVLCVHESSCLACKQPYR